MKMWHCDCAALLDIRDIRCFRSGNIESHPVHLQCVARVEVHTSPQPTLKKPKAHIRALRTEGTKLDQRGV